MNLIFRLFMGDIKGMYSLFSLMFGVPENL